MCAVPDFHVVSLRYRLVTSKHVTFVDPPAITFETAEALFRLDRGTLTCEMKGHFSQAADARLIVEPVLRAWEADADLQWNRGEWRFEFENAEVMDRIPAEPGVNRAYVHVTLGAAALWAVGTVSVHVTRGRYPDPPGTFRLTPDAQSLLTRYEGFRAGREPLLAMCYFCLTVLEANAGGRRQAATAYNIDEPVLRKIGQLTTKRGDRLSARKATNTVPLTAAESAWLEAAVRMLIWRVGDTRPKEQLPLITMSDLPSL